MCPMCHGHEQGTAQRVQARIAPLWDDMKGCLHIGLAAVAFQKAFEGLVSGCPEDIRVPAGGWADWQIYLARRSHAEQGKFIFC